MNDPVARSEDLRARFEELNRRLAAGVASPLQPGRWLGSAELLKSLTAGLVQDAERLMEIQNRYYRKQLELWNRLAHAGNGASPPETKPTAPGDRRFAGAEWRDHPYFQYLARSYLLSGEWLTELVGSTKLEPHTKRKLEFF